MMGDDITSTGTLDATRIGFEELRDVIFEMRHAYTRCAIASTLEADLTAQCLTTAHEVCTVTLRWIEHAAKLVELGDMGELTRHLAEHDRFAWWHRKIKVPCDIESDEIGQKATAQQAARVERETLARAAGRRIL